MLTKLIGNSASLRLIEEICRGAYQLTTFGAADLARARDVMVRYESAAIGLADASLVVLSERYGCLDLLTLDERHFRTLRGAGGKRFKLVPG